MSAWEAGSMWAWLYAWVMWRAPHKTAERVRWAAWRVRMAGEGDWRQRYEEAVVAGARPVPKAGKGKKQRQWARMCDEHGGREREVTGVALEMRVDGGRGRIEVRPKARKMMMEWRRTRKAGLPEKGYRGRGAVGMQTQQERAAGRRAAQREQ